MAEQTDITRWLLDAEDAVGSTDKALQITWLKEQRKPYAESARAGDWATESTSAESASSSSRRGISDKANHDAIVGALRKLGATDLGSRGALLSIQTRDILP